MSYYQVTFLGRDYHLNGLLGKFVISLCPDFSEGQKTT
jgi:hypothetical protein